MLTQAPEEYAENMLTQLPEDFEASGTLYLHSMSADATEDDATFSIDWGRHYTVGRSAGRDIRLEDAKRGASEQQVSGCHAVLWLSRDSADNLYVSVKSKTRHQNGLFIDGEPVQPDEEAVLVVGGHVSFGAKTYGRFRFVLSADRDRPITPASDPSPAVPTPSRKRSRDDDAGDSEPRRRVQRVERFGVVERPLRAKRGPPRPRQGVPDDHRSSEADSLAVVTKQRDELQRQLAAEKRKARDQKRIFAKQARREQHQAVNKARKDARSRVAGRRDQEAPTHDQKKKRRRARGRKRQS